MKTIQLVAADLAFVLLLTSIAATAAYAGAMFMVGGSWRRCGRCKAWWNTDQPRVTYVNKPEGCRIVIKSTCNRCRQ